MVNCMPVALVVDVDCYTVTVRQNRKKGLDRVIDVL